MKKRFLFMALLFVMATVLAGCGSDGDIGNAKDNTSSNTNSGETIKLRFADYMPNTHFSSVNAQQKWIEKVEELTDGRIVIEYFPGEQLGKAADMLDLVNTGAADIANVPQAYVSGKMPLSSVVSLPGLVEDPIQGSPAAYELINSSPVLEADFLKNGVVPVFAYTSGTYEFWTVDKPVTKVADLKGMKIRSQGGSANIQMETLGATPVTVSTAEQYEALERGTIDGTLFTTSSIPSYKLNEVVNYATIGAGGGPTLVMFIMNEKKWSSIPSDLQEKIAQATEEVMEEFTTKFAANDQEVIETLSSNGEVEFFEVDKAEFLEASVAVQEQWVNENSKIASQETLDLFKKLLDKANE